MKKICLALISILPLFALGQLQLTWEKIGEMEIQKEATIAIDSYNNLYITNGESINKIDSNFTLQFHQSSKKWGTISSIDARNPMKILFFSEEQQLIGFLDNTLTLQQKPIDLSDEGYSYVKAVAASAQDDKFWLFDADNSQITLFSSQKIQSQKVDNLYGLLRLKELNQLLEYGNRLFLLDTTQGIFILDRFGSWIDFIKIEGIENMTIVNNTIIYVKNGNLHFYNLMEKYQDDLIAPIDHIQQILINGDRFYLITDRKITAFHVKNKI